MFLIHEDCVAEVLCGTIGQELELLGEDDEKHAPGQSAQCADAR